MSANPITGKPSFLVEGRIPAGQPCPWATSCQGRMARCPTQQHPREAPFSCALARALDAFDDEIQRPEKESDA